MSSIEDIVVVGASLAGLSAAQELRAHGYAGRLSVVGDEPYLPYDRPPLSKTVIAGRMAPGHEQLPQARGLDVSWRLGTPARGLDRRRRVVSLDDGTDLPFDRVLIATGVRALSWPNTEEAALDGVSSIRTRDDARYLRARLDAGARRVVVIGGGFIGSELASACRDRGVEVTVVEKSPQPLGNALGETLGYLAAAVQRAAGVDLRLGTSVTAIEGDGEGRVAGVHFDDGTSIEADVVVTALGSRRNTEWLAGSGLAADRSGVTCDASMRAFTVRATVDDAVYAAGDVARWPHPVFDNQMVEVEHWSNAVDQARHAAREMLRSARLDRAHEAYDELPRFWSNQFGINITSLGIPRLADQLVLTQGSLDNRRCVIAYGRDGRTVGAVALNAPREIEGYELLIRQGAAFPPDLRARDWEGGPVPEPAPARFPGTDAASHEASAAVVGAAMVNPVEVLGFPTPAPAPALREDAL